MNKDKLDKIVDEIFLEIGDLRFNPFYNSWTNKDVLTVFEVVKTTKFSIPEYRILMRDQIPLINYLRDMLDHKTFISLMEKVADRFINIHKPELGRSIYKGTSSFHHVFVTYHE